MVNDRGSIKWSSMMLPEHAKLLRDLWCEDKKIHKPILDSQQLEWLNQEILSALEEKTTVELTFYRKKSMENIVGEIIKLDEQMKQVHILKGNKEIERLPFHEIIDLRAIN